MTTSKDVAKLAGVSVSAVSRAFRDDTYISKEKKDKIMAAAEALGYTPNLLARNLKRQKSKIIGLIYSDIDNPFFSTMTRVMEYELRQLGYRLIISHSNEDAGLEADNLGILAGHQVDGIIFTPISEKNRKLVTQLHKRGIPLVQMFRTMYDELDSVVVDDVNGAYQATKHLLEQGHSNILLLNVVNPYGPDRFLGYQQAFAEAGIPFQPSHVVQVPYQEKQVIHQALDSLKPTAVIAGTNAIGREVFMHCKAGGQAIPRDMGLIVFDDVHWTEMLDITAIQQPMEYLSLSACRAILDRIEGSVEPKSPLAISLKPALIKRTSV